MLQVTITPEIIERAEKKAALVGNIGGSITGSLSHVVGAIGEIIVADAIDAREVNTYDYDLMKGDERIDVKTKRCNTRPLLHYDCSVASHGIKQDCDSYIFVRIRTDLSKAWILGKILKSEFYTKATKHRRGDVDPANGYEFRADCYNLPIEELRDVESTTIFADGSSATRR